MSKSVIDEWLVMKGDLESEGDILVKGKVLGNVRCKVLIVDKEAVIEGGIIAEEVFVRGTTTGKIRARRVNLQETAKVLSEIEHQTFAAEEGAHIEGALKRIEGSLFKEQRDKKSAPQKAKKETDAKTAAIAPVAAQNSRGEAKTNGTTLG